MKIEWLNPEKTRAIVTKGWLRKVWAEVYKHSDAWWHFSRNGKRVSSYLDTYLDRERARVELVEPWQPVASIPPVRLIARTGNK